MAFVSEALLDKLEPFFTKQAKRWESETPPHWYAVLRPSVTLKPNEKYTRQIYWRETTVPTLSVVLFIAIGMIFPLAYLWYQYPPFFTNPKFHKLLIGFLSHEGYYWMPLALVFLIAFGYGIYLPRFYFWNRRAARLQANPVVEELPTVTVDAGVWPPPPSNSATL
jgi:hypothetical protein